MLLAAFSAGTSTYFSWSSFKHSFTEFSSRIPCLLDSTVFLRLLTLNLFVSHAVPSPEGTHILGFLSLPTFLHGPQWQ